jgi:hypothetical protein
VDQVLAHGVRGGTLDQMATALAPAELTSLQNLARTPDADIPAEHRDQLTTLGLIVDVLGVTKLTSVGVERLKDAQSLVGQ